MDLNGKVVLLTGASGGIGAATTAVLLGRGATVAAAGRRADRLAALGAASTHTADLCDPADALRLADEVEAAHGGVDVLINNAGLRIDGAISEISLDDLDRSFQVNALTPFVLAGRLAPAMAERGEGVVVNVVAPKVSGGRRGMGAYAASKAALESLTQTLRQEVGGGKGVAVFAFDPGWVKTELAPDGPESPDACAARLVAHIEAAKSSREILT